MHVYCKHIKKNERESQIRLKKGNAFDVLRISLLRRKQLAHYSARIVSRRKKGSNVKIDKSVYFHSFDAVFQTGICFLNLPWLHFQDRLSRQLSAVRVFVGFLFYFLRMC